MKPTLFWNAVLRRTVLTIMILAMVGVATYRPAWGQDSPIAALEAIDKTILEAESLDDILPFLPPEAEEFISQMPPEQQEALLEQEKGRVGREKYLAERVDGDQAVVVAGRPSKKNPKGVRFIKMSRVDGVWKRTGEEEYIVEALAGASGSYSVSGAVSVELEDGMVSLLVRTIEIADLAKENLGDGSKVARIKIPFPEQSVYKCFEPGKMPIGTVVEIVDGKTYTFHGGFIPAGVETEQGYYRDITGTLDVIPSEGDRFSGRYEFTVANDAGETVMVSGRLDRALMPCYGTPENARQ